MKNISTEKLIKEFKRDLRILLKIDLDFRKKLDYDTAKVVTYLHEWCNDFIEEHQENYPHFHGFEYNLSMAVEELRTRKLKDVIEEKMRALFVNHVETYRRDGNKVFKYCAASRAYIFDHIAVRGDE